MVTLESLELGVGEAEAVVGGWDLSLLYPPCPYNKLSEVAEIVKSACTFLSFLFAHCSPTRDGGGADSRRHVSYLCVRATDVSFHTEGDLACMIGDFG